VHRGLGIVGCNRAEDISVRWNALDYAFENYVIVKPRERRMS
jgi:hypothetical protein